MYLKKNKVIEGIFYITIAVYFLFSILTLSMLEDYTIVTIVAKLVRYASYALFLFIIMCNIIEFNKKITIKSIIINFINYFRAHILLALILVNTVIILLKTRERTPLIIVLLIWACSFYNFKKIIRLYFNVGFLFMICTWFFSLLEIIPEIIIWREGKIRYSLGYVYPLETMTHFLFLTICFIYLIDKKFGIKEYIIINMLGFLLYIVTDARTSYYLLLLVTTVGLIYSKTSIEILIKKIKAEFFYVIVMSCFAVSTGAGVLFNDNINILVKLDNLLSGRIGLMNEAFHKYGINAFGQKIEWVGFGGSIDTSALLNSYNFVDCAYAKMLLDYGIIFSLFILIGYCYIYRQAVKNQDCILLLVISIVLVVSIMEPRLISIETNPFMLLLGGFFTQTNKSNFKLI